MDVMKGVQDTFPELSMGDDGRGGRRINGLCVSINNNNHDDYLTGFGG